MLKTYSTGFVNGMVTFVDITPQIGIFTPSILIYFRQLQELNISGCVNIDAVLFVDCSVTLENLIKLIMRACYQFSQYLIVKTGAHHAKLEYFDFVGCCEITHSNLYTLCLVVCHSFSALTLNPKTLWKTMTISKSY